MLGNSNRFSFLTYVLEIHSLVWERIVYLFSYLVYPLIGKLFPFKSVNSICLRHLSIHKKKKKKLDSGAYFLWFFLVFNIQYPADSMIFLSRAHFSKIKDHYLASIMYTLTRKLNWTGSVDNFSNDQSSLEACKPWSFYLDCWPPLPQEPFSQHCPWNSPLAQLDICIVLLQRNDKKKEKMLHTRCSKSIVTKLTRRLNVFSIFYRKFA